MIDTPLFDRYPRERQRKNAFRKSDPDVIARYHAVLQTFRGKVFGAWHVTSEYERLHGALSRTDQRALGEMFTRLKLSGEIVEAGMGRRKNGSKADTYRFK